MSMIEWAEKEIEIACRRENQNRKEGEWDYGCVCYESALKAFKSLVEDGHSGLSIGFTKQILNNLIDGKPLTPIEDTDDIWYTWGRYNNNNYIVYQCERMSSLFKYVYDDGHVEYHDNYRFVCIDSNDITYHNKFISSIIEEMVEPITMPYMPAEPIKVYADDYLYDPKNGDFDTIAIWYYITPNGKTVRVNRYFKNDGRGWVEIDDVEFAARKIAHTERINSKKEEE